MKRQLQPIPSGKFTYDQTTRTFTAEESDLRGYDLRQTIYDDAVDVGFSIQSSKTGAEVTYYLSEVHTHDGDITHWTFLPTRESFNKHREAVNTKVVIFND
jgi:hypothetical protein